jgi:hypothetical protein
MTRQPNKRLAWLFIFSIFAIALYGCAPTGAEPGAPQSLNPTVVVVQYVTQVVATPTPAAATAVPLPTAAPAAQAAQIGFDPFTVPIYYPLKGCSIASRLHVGDRAVVADTRGGTLGLHMTADVGDSPIFRKLVPGEIVDIVGGPFCRTESLVWEVFTVEQEHGFLSEGNGNSYWVLPSGEGISKETQKTISAMKRARIKLGVPADCLPR